MLRKLRMPTRTEGVSISLQSWLIDMLDHHARNSNKKRSEIISEAVRRYLIARYDSPEFWEGLYQKEIIGNANL